jgi:hypothetical protein
VKLLQAAHPFSHVSSTHSSTQPSHYFTALLITHLLSPAPPTPHRSPFPPPTIPSKPIPLAYHVQHNNSPGPDKSLPALCKYLHTVSAPASACHALPYGQFIRQAKRKSPLRYFAIAMRWVGAGLARTYNTSPSHRGEHGHYPADHLCYPGVDSACS